MELVTRADTPPEYVAARRVLLDALAALEAHLDAMVLVGAQAVYLHTGDADLGIAPTTTDADIVLSPDRLADQPLLREALVGALFSPGPTPGALEPGDGRRFRLRVAGPAALLVAKVIKIAERHADQRRMKPKDGMDVLLLLQRADLTVVANRLNSLAGDPMAGAVTRQALAELRDNAQRPDGPIAVLAATALPASDWDSTTLSVASLVEELLDQCHSVTE